MRIIVAKTNPRNTQKNDEHIEFIGTKRSFELPVTVYIESTLNVELYIYSRCVYRQVKNIILAYWIWQSLRKISALMFLLIWNSVVYAKNLSQWPEANGWYLNHQYELTMFLSAELFHFLFLICLIIQHWSHCVIKNDVQVKLQSSRRNASEWKIAPSKFIELESEWAREREID